MTPHDEAAINLGKLYDEASKMLSNRSGMITSDEQRMIESMNMASLSATAVALTQIAKALEEGNRIAAINAKNGEQVACTLGAIHDIYFNRG